MGKSQKSNEKQLKGLILSRFFFVLVIVSMVELIVVALTNTYLIPNLVKIMKYDSVIQVNGAEGLFIIVFVLLMTLVANKIFPTLKISPVDVNNFLEGILVRHGFYGTDAAEATETIRIITEHPTILLSLLGSFLLVVLILITPYVIGGIAYAISIAKSIRRFEREKEIERRKEEKRRYLMISNIVHDLKTPMTTVYGYAKALNDGVVPKGKETEYTLRAIPIGGFCQMAGEDMEDDELKKIPKNKRLQSKTVWQRFLIMFFGAGNNFISAVLILFFAYFYAQIQFNPADVSLNIQQHGGFIPGIRPGKPTMEYLKKVSNRITLFGAIFLAFLALVPSVLFSAVAVV